MVTLYSTSSGTVTITLVTFPTTVLLTSILIGVSAGVTSNLETVVMFLWNLSDAMNLTSTSCGPAVKSVRLISAAPFLIS